MTTSLRWLLAAGLVTAGLGLSVAPVAASKAPPPANSGIIDGAKLFSEDAVKKARDRVEQIRKDYGKGLFIETIAKAESKDAVDRMAADKYKDHQVGGVYVLICKDPQRIRIQVGDKTRQRAFTTAKRDQLLTIFQKNFKEKKFDEGLMEGIAYVDKTFDSTIGKGTTDTGSTAATTKTKGASTMNPIWGWICIGLVVILAIWLVVGLIRAFTRPAAGPGYAGGGGYGGGGGGGGGFFSSMLGGLFGAAAGMWLYDSFFRSHTPSPMGGSTAYGGESTGGVDDTGSTGAGGDYGGDADAGGGGGDWGGGGDADAGGGGDWGGGDAGGGGGDWGGGDAGGGGDWGGGGGGDWGGGGGGDW